MNALRLPDCEHPSVAQEAASRLRAGRLVAGRSGGGGRNREEFLTLLACNTTDGEQCADFSTLLFMALLPEEQFSHQTYYTGGVQLVTPVKDQKVGVGIPGEGGGGRERLSSIAGQALPFNNVAIGCESDAMVCHLF